MLPCVINRLEIVAEGIVLPLPEVIKPDIPTGGVAVADQRKDVPGTFDVRIIAAFCDPEQIVWEEGFATASDTGCTFTSKFVGIPGHPILFGTITYLTVPIRVPVLVKV